jgi:AraC family transcriptional regulator
VVPGTQQSKSLFLFHRLQVARARQFLRAHATEDVTLEEVARAAGASPFHFSRLYHALARETVFESLGRIRLERAARQLCEEREIPVSKVALAVGYATPSSFSKAFRDALGVPPSRLRVATPSEQKRLLGELAARAKLEPKRRSLRLSRAPSFRRLEPRRVVFVRELGPYTEVAPLAWSKLRARASRAWLLVEGAEHIGVAYDDPGNVREELLRYDACIAVPPGREPPPGTHAGALEGGEHAVFEYRGPYRYIADAFDRIFRAWVPRSGVRLRRGPYVEIYRSDPRRTPEDALTTELLLPVEART